MVIVSYKSFYSHVAHVGINISNFNVYMLNIFSTRKLKSLPGTYTQKSSLGPLGL